MTKSLDFEEVSALLRYEKDTGKLYWLPRSVKMFTDARAAKSWNARYAGHEAFTASDSNGYRVGNIYNRAHRAHRVIWLLTSGSWPLDEVDHINGDKSDNTLANLRAVSHSENLKNQRRNTNNASGVTGVFWIAQCKRWVAFITVAGKRKHLGLFEHLDAAAEARKRAEVLCGFSPNHGRPA